MASTALSPTTFADLTPDALRAVLRRLELREVVTLSAVCHALRELCGEEPLWRSLCASWGNAHAASPFDAELARRALQLHSFRSLRRVLHEWRGDPLGVWRLEIPGHDGVPRPDGGLVLGSLLENKLLMSFLPRVGSEARDESGQEDLSYVPLAENQYYEAPCGAGGLRLATRKSVWPVAMCDGDDPNVLWCSFVDGVDLAEYDLAPLLTVHGTPDGQPAFKLRRATGLPVGWSAPPAAGEAEPCCLRPGLYTAPYGPHGQEVILVRRCPADAPAEQPLPDNLPADTPRWEGLKISGDRNVPTGRLTFVAAPAEPSAEALQQALGDERIIVSFANPQEPMQVNLRERGLTAARAAWGQINVQPGVWDPQWVPRCTLLEYAAGRPAGARQAARPIAFSMLWNDEARLAHIIDFTPMLPAYVRQMGTLEWARLHAHPNPDDEDTHAR